MISRRQLWALLALTLMWGVNWPMMKLSLQELSPLYFRASTMLLGAAWLFVYVAAKGERMWPVGREWKTIAWLGLPNVLGWHTLSIFGVQELASGRAAILGFTMPIFTVLLGAAFFGERITPRVRLAVISVSVAIALLLWHELWSLTGRPAGIAWMLGAAVSWALGTLMFRRAHLTLSPLVVTVWMLLLGSWVVAGRAVGLGMGQRRDGGQRDGDQGGRKKQSHRKSFVSPQFNRGARASRWCGGGLVVFLAP